MSSLSAQPPSNVLGKFASGAEEVDLRKHIVVLGPLKKIEYILQWRIRDDAPVHNNTRRRISDRGNDCGKAPLAMTCSGPIL